MSEPSIECAALVRTYASGTVSVPALRGLDLTVASGELVTVVGPPASGKSTLIGVLAGLDRPTSGLARVCGRDVTALGRRQRIRHLSRTVGIVWPDPARNLLPYLSAAENVAVPMMLAGWRGRRRRQERVSELLELVKAGHCRDHRPTELTIGEQQRVALATALANSPHVLLADDPARLLHRAEAHELVATVEHAHAVTGVTVLLTGRQAGPRELAGRTIRIQHGRAASLDVDSRAARR